MEGTLTNSATDSDKCKTCQVRCCIDNKTTKMCSKYEEYIYGKCKDSV